MVASNAVNCDTTGQVAFNASTGVFTASSITQHAVIVGGSSNALVNVGPSASTGQVLQSQGSSGDPAFSTATFPATATSTGTILRADGTNWSATTATFPNTTTSQQIIYSSSNNTVGGLATGNSLVAATNASGTLAMRSFSINIQVFTSSGTYTASTGLLYATIECVGGGGAGGGAASTSTTTIACGGGGGAGGYARKTASAATIGASQTVTIGAAGTPGTAGNNPGGNGGTTSLGVIVSATGGTGGNGSAASSSSSVGAGGAGGAGSSGDFNTTGQPGFQGVGSISAGIFSFANGGAGGSSFFGGGAAGVSNAAGGAANSSGGGGSGAANLNVTASAAAGGAGVKGIIVVTEFIIN